MFLTVAVEIKQSKEAVWKLISDIENASDFISGIVNVEVLHRPEDGLKGFKWTETRMMFGKEAKETMWITDAVENDYYSTWAESHGMIYQSKLSLVETDGLTQLTMTFEGTAQTLITKFMSGLMGLIFGSSTKKLLKKDLLDIKAYLEMNTQGTSE